MHYLLFCLLTPCEDQLSSLGFVINLAMLVIVGHGSDLLSNQVVSYMMLHHLDHKPGTHDGAGLLLTTNC